MDYLTAVHTDVGIRRKTNQDAALIRVADTDYGRVVLAVVCDGIGGLARGEVASAALIRAFLRWFDKELPYLLQKGLNGASLHDEWETLIRETNRRIADYGRVNRLSLGTTAAALLLMEPKYYIVNIGDSRVYRITDRIDQLTKDQTYVQREIDEGRMTWEEAAAAPWRSVLLQCVGASPAVVPDYYAGEFGPQTVFMLCSDGFHHELTQDELYRSLNPGNLRDETGMSEQAACLTELIKDRKENDNITVALIKACQGEEYAGDRFRRRRKIQDTEYSGSGRYEHRLPGHE